MALLLGITVNAQNYLINFTGSGASTTVDSVKVENLTKGVNVTVLGTDTLHLGTVGINEMDIKNNYLKVYPNPMQGEAELSFYAKQFGNVQLSIYDISGRTILKINDKLLKGSHTFKLSCLKQGMYFIYINGENFSYSTKIISQHSTFCEAKLEYKGGEKEKETFTGLKSTKATINIAFSNGDIIRFTGYSNNYYSSTTVMPTGNLVLTFYFTASLPSLTTTIVSSITNTTASSGGNISDDGGAIVTERGICYHTYSNPTTINPKIICGSDTGSFTANLTNLIPSTTYYVRAYAINNEGTAYGIQENFSTLPLQIPSVSTINVSNISATTATSGGYISSDGGDSVFARGICYSTTPNPTIANSLTNNGTGTGMYSSYLTGLTSTTFYYVRAYANNNIGTAYGNQMSFVTMALLPTLTTASATLITLFTATSGGNITSNGGAPISTRGICYSTIADPTTLDAIVSNGSGSGLFTSNLTGLTTGTLYYVKAFASNNAGTAYGNQISFTTIPLQLPIVSTAPISNVSATTAISGGNVTSDGGAFVTLRGICYSSTTNPSTADILVTNGTGPGSFISNLNGLLASTTYYARAFATNSEGTAYGNQISFTTIPLQPPSVNTTFSSGGVTTAIFGGNVTSDGGTTVMAKGICYNIITNPTTANSIVNNGNGTGSFTSNLTGLTASTTYYVKAYAINSIGTAYGNEINFTTYSLQIPDVSTTIASSITSTTASSGGYVTFDGGDTILTRGICYSNSTMPTIANSIITTGSGVGSFTSNLTNLIPAFTYYVRAFATNNIGIAYGYQISFTTLPSTQLANVSLIAIKDITKTSVVLNCNVVSDGGDTVTTRGVCYSTSVNPTIANDTLVIGNGTGSFYSTLINLLPNTNYFSRAFATNSIGTSYSNQVGFITLPIQIINSGSTTGNALIDVDGNGYDTVKIGNQVWMKQNLKVKHYRNGVIIPKVTNSSQWGNLATSAYCWYNNDSVTYNNAYGLMYNWFTVVDSNKLCPSGWHIPDNEEWTCLYNYIGGASMGGALKDTGNTHWSSPNSGATNATDFTALPGGTRSDIGMYSQINGVGYWWTSTLANSNTSYTHYLNYNDSATHNINYFRKRGLSVRCISDESIITSYLPIVTTLSVESITSKTATVYGKINFNGGSTTTETGFCFSINPHPTIADELISIGGVNISSIGGYFLELLPATSYYVRAYSTNSKGTTYGNQIFFTTLTNTPSVTTISAFPTSDTTATVSGEVINDGGLTITTRGICYSTSTNPTLSANTVICGSGTGLFTATLTNLFPNTKFYVKAFATNNLGTAYGNQLFFKKSLSVQFPVVSTSNVTTIMATSAFSGGNVTSEGGASVSAKGVCWSTQVNPSINDNHTTYGNGLGSFTDYMEGLSPNTTYYLRAYTVNGIGIGYGNTINFTTLPINSSTVIDIDGNIYDEVQIGTQIWMKQNLKVTHFRNGDTIPYITDNLQWYSDTSGAYCNFNNDAYHAITYGRLYNFYTVVDSRNLCPINWHIPTDSEWTILTILLGGNIQAGGKLKEAGLNHWESPNTGATNNSGFSALPGGYRYYNGAYNILGQIGYWWSSSVDNNNLPLSCLVSNLSSEIISYSSHKRNGRSIRCIKN